MTRLVWLFLFISVYWWGNTPLLLETRLAYASSPRLNNSSSMFFPFFKLILLADIFLVFLANLFFGVFVAVKYSSNRFFQDLFKFWLNLPILNRLALFVFTITLAIPNKIWIYNKINRALIGIGLFLLLLVGFWYHPIGFIFYVNYVGFIAFSYFFGLFYEKYTSFSSFINHYFFNNDTIFAGIYFDFFWGNMFNAARTTASKAAAPAAAAAAAALEAKRQQELDAASKHGDKQAILAHQNSQEGFATPEEFAQYKKEKAEEYIDQRGVVTKGLKKIGEYLTE